MSTARDRAKVYREQAKHLRRRRQYKRAGYAAMRARELEERADLEDRQEHRTIRVAGRRYRVNLMPSINGRWTANVYDGTTRLGFQWPVANGSGYETQDEALAAMRAQLTR